MRLSRSPQELSNGWFQTGHAFPLFRPSDSRADTPVITGPRVTNVNDFSRWRKIVLIFKSFQRNSLDIEAEIDGAKYSESGKVEGRSWPIPSRI